MGKSVAELATVARENATRFGIDLSRDEMVCDDYEDSSYIRSQRREYDRLDKMASDLEQLALKEST